MKGYDEMLAGIRSRNDSATVRSVIDAYFDSWRTGNIEARASLFSETASFADPVGTPKFEGLEAIRGFWTDAAKAPVATRPVVDRVIICGDEALVVFTMFLDMGSRTVGSLEVHERFVFDGSGKISELQPFWDRQSVNVGLG